MSTKCSNCGKTESLVKVSLESQTSYNRPNAWCLKKVIQSLADLDNFSKFQCFCVFEPVCKFWKMTTYLLPRGSERFRRFNRNPHIFALNCNFIDNLSEKDKILSIFKLSSYLSAKNLQPAVTYCVKIDNVIFIIVNIFGGMQNSWGCATT